MESRATRIGLGVWTVLVVAFLWFPLVLIALYALGTLTTYLSATVITAALVGMAVLRRMRAAR